MRWVRRSVSTVVIGWAVLSALAALGLRAWLRERHGRGGPIPVSQAGMLLRPARRYLHPVGPTLARFRIGPGDVVLELGPGPGYFTPEAARFAGARGRVLCLDVQPGMIALLRDRLREQDVSNVDLIVADAARLPLREASVDRAFLVTVLGEVPDRPAALTELRRALRPGGVLGFLETLTDPDYVLEDTLRDLCRATGFEPLEHERTRLGYTMTFLRPERR